MTNFAAAFCQYMADSCILEPIEATDDQRRVALESLNAALKGVVAAAYDAATVRCLTPKILEALAGALHAILTAMPTVAEGYPDLQKAVDDLHIHMASLSSLEPKA